MNIGRFHQSDPRETRQNTAQQGAKVATRLPLLELVDAPLHGHVDHDPQLGPRY